MKTILRASWVSACLLASSACGGGGSAAPSATPAGTPDLTGTWTGGAGDFSLTWQLQQSGGTVTGNSQYSDSKGFSGKGHVTGTRNGDVLTFTDEYPAGALSDPSCVEREMGTLTIEGNEMHGHYQGSSSCGHGGSGNFTLTR